MKNNNNNITTNNCCSFEGKTKLVCCRFCFASSIVLVLLLWTLNNTISLLTDISYIILINVCHELFMNTSGGERAVGTHFSVNVLAKERINIFLTLWLRRSKKNLTCRLFVFMCKSFFSYLFNVNRLLHFQHTHKKETIVFPLLMLIVCGSNRTNIIFGFCLPQNLLMVFLFIIAFFPFCKQ